MITGIGRFGASALRRQAPKADGFAFRCESVASRPLRYPGMHTRIVAIQHPCDGTLRLGDPITASARTANYRIPIAD
jgi:hypothetical protein